jgi:hypothetical protein
MLPADPLPWLLDSDEPAARWIALTQLLDRPADDAEVAEAHAAVLADAGTVDLLGRLKSWEAEIPLSGHDKVDFAPNLLTLLADMGVTAADEPRIGAILASMLEHQRDDGAFMAVGRWRTLDEPVWGSLPCDAFAIAEVIARVGHADDPRVERAFAHIARMLADTPQGRAWQCVPDPAIPFRGPGRKADVCPQVTLEALRAFSYLPAERRPAEVVAAGRVSLAVWRDRWESKPYMFGHGRQFKRGKWPATWYSALEVVDTIGRYPELWADTGGDSPGGDPAGGDPAATCPADRRALAEIAACLIAYNFDADGRVAPRSCYKGFEQHSFGQKKLPSAFATARTLVALRRLGPLASEIAQVDVLSLGSSKGGKGTALAP